jgi:hypothetical protein
MGTELKATLRVEVPGAGTVAATQKVEVEAYDRIAVALPGKTNGATPVQVDVQPGGAGQVKLLLITANAYEDVTYEVDGSGTSVTLDAPQLLVGTGAVGLLLGPVNTIEFTNDGTQEVKVEILVGRDAIPPPP